MKIIGNYKILTLIVGAISLLPMSTIINANLNGRWIQHPAAALRSAAKYSQVDRIIEGERYVYFSVRGGYLNRGASSTYTSQNNFDPIQIFRYDKTLPWGEINIRPLAQDVDLSGSLPVVIDYSAEMGILVLIYDNKALDLIYDDGTVVHSKALTNLTIPVSTVTPYSVTFDKERNELYVAGSFGYAVLETNTGEIKNMVLLDKPVSWAGRVGENIVVFAGTISQRTYSTSAYVFPENNIPSSLTQPASGAVNLQALMPLGKNTFAALARGANDQTNILKLFTIEGNQLKAETLKEGLTVDASSGVNYRHMFQTDGYYQNTRDGYMVNSIDNLYFLKKNTEGENLLTTVSKSSLTSNERQSKSASLDGSKIWLYTYDYLGTENTSPKGFYSYTLQEGKWSGKSSVEAPNAPTCMFAGYGEWNPKYGLILRSGAAKYSESEPDIDRLFSYKDGKWTDLSYSAHNSLYVNPTSFSRNVNSDPSNPDMIWGCSNKNGLNRIDLGDYDNCLVLGSTNYNGYKDQYPGYFPIFEPFKAWTAIINFSNVTFDKDNTMWFGRYMYPDGSSSYETNKNAYVPVYYLTEEERLSVENIGSDLTKIPDLLNREIRIPETFFHVDSRIIALQHPDNENYILGSSCSTGKSKGFILDHNGTPSDPLDDRFVVINSLTVEDGQKIDTGYERGIYEDVNNGEVWFFTSAGPFIIKPNKYIDGDYTCRKVKITRKEGIDVEEYPFENLSIYYVSDDYIGRKWIATERGLYCLSKDGKELLGQYTSANAPLPSDVILNVVPNPETASIFVLTDRGIVEFQPEGSSAVVPDGEHLSIWPATVTPEYKGFVTIQGAQGDIKYTVVDGNGYVVKDLGKADLGIIQWDLKDNNGNRVKAGRYNINREGKTENHKITILAN